jgi:Fe-S-cluster containining protein
MRGSSLVPWTEVHSWACVACGNCCVGYRVPLKMDEMVKVSAVYGPSVLEYGMGKAYLKNQSNGRCIFQKPLMDRCRLFPFRIHKKPVYKRGDTAGIRFKGKKYYLYLDPDCKGIVPGQPSDRFMNQVVPEIMNIGIGLPVKQKYTTSKSIHWRPI